MSSIYDFPGALAKAKGLVRDYGRAAAVMVKLDGKGGAIAWNAQLADEPSLDSKFIVAGFVSASGIVVAYHEAFSRARAVGGDQRG